jgi:hypothetical protein
MKHLLRLVALHGSPLLWASAAWAVRPAAVDHNYALTGGLIMSWVIARIVRKLAVR